MITDFAWSFFGWVGIVTVVFVLAYGGIRSIGWLVVEYHREKISTQAQVGEIERLKAEIRQVSEWYKKAYPEYMRAIAGKPKAGDSVEWPSARHEMQEVPKPDSRGSRSES